MGHVLVELKTLKNQKNKLGKEGREGICYILPNNKVIKLFHGLDKDRKILFDNLYNSQIAFPIDILYDNQSNLIAGYTMEYLQGECMLDGLRKDIDIQDLKSAYLKIRIIMLKYKNIYMDDLCLENILYDYKNNNINIIDTSSWYEKQDGFIDNIENFNWQLMTALLYSININYVQLKQNKEINEILKMYENHIHDISMFLEFLNNLEKYVSENNGQKVKTIKDMSLL